tara:strand:- start:1041 stop:1532 length:492 start_codon:yes stop_codon:yes gene_type:complete
MVFHIVTDLDDYYKHIMDKRWANNLIICYFTATWCGPCQMISPDITTLGEKSDALLVLKIDVDDCEEVAAQCEIDCMPTFRFHIGNTLEPSHKLMGADKNKLFNIVGGILGELKDRAQAQTTENSIQPSQQSSESIPEQPQVRKNTQMDMPFLYNPIPEHKFQ